MCHPLFMYDLLHFHRILEVLLKYPYDLCR